MINTDTFPDKDTSLISDQRATLRSSKLTDQFVWQEGGTPDTTDRLSLDIRLVLRLTRWLLWWFVMNMLSNPLQRPGQRVHTACTRRLFGLKSHINEDAVMESAPVESVLSPNIKWLHTYGGISSASLIHSTVSHWHAYLWQHISLCTKLPAHSSSLIANRLSLSLTNILATSKLQNAWIFEHRHFDSSNKSLSQTGTRLLITVQSDPVNVLLLKAKLWWTQHYCWLGLSAYMRKHNNVCDDRTSYIT